MDYISIFFCKQKTKINTPIDLKKLELSDLFCEQNLNFSDHLNSFRFFFGYSKPKLKQIDLIRSLGLYFDFFVNRKPKLILIDLKKLELN